MISYLGGKEVRLLHCTSIVASDLHDASRFSRHMSSNLFQAASALVFSSSLQPPWHLRLSQTRQ